MKRLTLPAALFVLGSAPTLLANDHHTCTGRSIAGSYAYTTSGTRIGIGLVAGVGRVTLDKDGNVTDGKQTVSFNGLILDETFTGTYTLNDDCTGSSVLNVISSNPAFNRTSNLDLVWYDDSSGFRFIFTNANTILSGDGRQIH